MANPLDITSWANGVNLPETAGPRGFTMRPGGPLQTPGGLRPGQMGSSSATWVPRNPRNLPAIRPNMSPTPTSRVIDTTGRIIPNVSSNVGAGIEGMGDFADTVLKGGEVANNISRLGKLGRFAKGSIIGTLPMLAGDASIAAANTVDNGPQVLATPKQQNINPFNAPTTPIFGIPGRPFSTRAHYANTQEGTPLNVQVANDSGARYGYTQNTPLPVFPRTSVTPEETKAMQNAVPTPPDPNGFAIVDGKKINYGDIGNLQKDSVLKDKNTDKYSFSIVPSEQTTSSVGGTNIADLLKAIQGIQPVQSYTDRLSGIQHGNNTWDMNGIDQMLAARQGQSTDEQRFAHQLGALGTLGATQMNADAARFGDVTRARSEEAKNAYMAPYYSALGKEAGAKADVTPLNAKAEVLKAIQEKTKDNPALASSLRIIEGMAQTDPAMYNKYAKQIAKTFRIVLPAMPITEG